MPAPSFAALPREVRLHILSFTMLIRRYDDLWCDYASPAAATIHDSKLVVPHCKCPNGLWTPAHISHCASHQGVMLIPFPAALWLVSKAMNADAREVFWTRQRFVLVGELPKMERWLRTLREVERIKKLEIRLSSGDVVVSIGHGNQQREKEWQEVANAIAHRCTLERLWLSIDVGGRWMAEGWRGLWMDDTWECYESGDGGRTLRKTWEGLVEPIAKATWEGGRGRLARFHLFLCCGFEAEAIAEKRVMGPQYDSEKERKVSHWERVEKCPPVRVSVLEWEERRVGKGGWMNYKDMERFL